MAHPTQFLGHTMNKNLIAFLKQTKNTKNGTLAVLNIADFKRYNEIFGHQSGDKIIAFLEEVLTKNLNGSDIFLRVGGDEWVVFFAERDDAVMHAVIRDFATTRHHPYGWTGVAKVNGQSVDAQEVVPASIDLRMRCVYSPILASVAPELLVNWMRDVCHGFCPDVPKSFTEASLSAPPYWHALEHPALASLYCPSCRASNFDWIDGDETFSCDGFCLACGAEVNFRNIDKVE